MPDNIPSHISFLHNKRLVVVSAVTLIGALGYGIIIPVLFAYAYQFGLSYFALGILFSTYSMGQFISTPFIGMLSDKYGRRPLLIVSQLGTTISFFMLAFAPGVIFLFLARALDGITAGNIPITQAIVSDTFAERDRTKGFGLIGACYGIGLIAGPAIAAVTAGISIQLPFIIACVLSIITTVLTMILLDETNQHIGVTVQKKLFAWRQLAGAVLDRGTGTILLVSFLWSFATGIFIYNYQPYALKILHLTPSQISLSFLLFGVIAAVTQLFIISRISSRFGHVPTLRFFLAVLSGSFILFLLSHGVTTVIGAIIFLAISSTAVQTLIQTLLSLWSPPERQGEILGIGTSYNSIGQIVGPITAGSIAAFGITYAFLISAVAILFGFILSWRRLGSVRNLHYKPTIVE